MLQEDRARYRMEFSECWVEDARAAVRGLPDDLAHEWLAVFAATRPWWESAFNRDGDLGPSIPEAFAWVELASEDEPARQDVVVLG